MALLDSVEIVEEELVNFDGYSWVDMAEEPEPISGLISGGSGPREVGGEVT